MQIWRRSSMNTEVDGCEDKARLTLTSFSQSRRSSLPNHPRREFGLNLDLPSRPILSLVDTKYSKDTHNPHPQYRIRNPLAWAVSPSESKGHPRCEGVTLYDSPIFTEVPFRVKYVGLRVLALFVMNLPTEKQHYQSRPSQSMDITNQTLGKIIVPETRQDQTSLIKSCSTPFGMKYPSKTSSQQVM